MIWIGRVLVVLALAAGIAVGDELSGQVIDASGEPVVGAEVWVAGVAGPGPMIPDGELLASVTSDEDGRFELTYEPVRNTGPRTNPTMVAARKPGLALGWAMLREGNDVVTLKLKAAVATSLTITDEADVPLPGVQVALKYVMSVDMAQGMRSLFFVPEELRERLSWDGGDEGRVEFDLLPKESVSTFEIATADRGAVICMSMAMGSEIRMRIGEPASLTGRVTGPEANALGGLTVSMMGRYPEGWNPFASEGYMAQIKVTTDAEGRFAVETLPPGTYRVAVRLDENPQWLIAEQTRFTAESGEAVEDLEIALQRGWPVTGRVVEAGSSEPVAGVTVMTLDSAGQQATTDEEGKFTLHALPGQVRLYAAAPKEYLNLQTLDPVDVVAETGATIEDIELERAAVVSGVVVDEAGEPVHGAEVWASVTQPPAPAEDDAPAEDGQPRMEALPATQESLALTDDGGRFEFAQLPIGATLAIHAGTMTAVTARATTVVATEETEPLELVVSEDAAGFATGRVVDDEGQPQAGVAVYVSRPKARVAVYVSRPSDERRALGHRSREVTTDADGRYHTGALIVGMTWQVAVGGNRPDDNNSEEWMCARGETQQLPDIVIDIAKGTLAGIVVDADGQPIAGIEVFNAGDGPKAVTATTDAEGRFELDGLWDGTAWAFARVPEYRIARARGETGSTDLIITLLPADARPDAPAKPPVNDLAARRALAEELALEALERIPPGETHLRGRMMAALARANPALAEQIWRDEGGQMTSVFIEGLALGLAETDADAAIGWLMKVESSARATGLIAVGRAVGELEPELAAEAFSLAATAAGAATREVQQIKLLAQAAEGLLLLGYPGGADVARQAAEIVRTSENDGWSRVSNLGIVARALALVDVDEALALVNLIKEIDSENQYGWQRGKTMQQVACAVAHTDPDRALEIASTDVVAWQYNQPTEAAQLAYEMYEADPDRALEYARGVTNPAHRSLAVGYLALRQDDQAQAWELIEEATALLAQLAAGMAGRNTGEEYGGVTARLAWIAQEVEYPDVQRLVTMALTMRSPRSRVIGERNMYNFNKMSGPLVWVDAEVARTLLEPAITAPEIFNVEKNWQWQKIMWVMATADPAWAAMKMRELVAARADTQPRKRWQWHVELALYLVLTREEQMHKSFDNWIPGKQAE